MTNFSPDKPGWQRSITRERILVLLPLLLGLLVAGALFAAIGLPMRGRLEDQRQRLTELQMKRGSINSQEQLLEETDADLVNQQQKQTLLVDLLAGRGQIQTFLAMLSREAAASGVVISLYEPIVVPEPAPDKTALQNQTTQADQASAASKDPMKALGYTKSSVLLQVDGPYPGLLQFLRRLEWLELLVQPTDLSLVALKTPGDAEEQAFPRTRLKLTLTFFDQVAESGDGADGQVNGSGTSSKGGSPAEQPPA